MDERIDYVSRVIPQTETYFPMSVDQGTVVTLLHFEGTPGSQNFVDHSGWNHKYFSTVPGNIIDNTQSVFGGTSCFFDGTGGLHNDNSLNDFTFSNFIPFSVDLWVRPADLAATRSIIDFGAENVDGWQFYHNTLGDLFFFINGVDAVFGGGALFANQWTHVAVAGIPENYPGIGLGSRVTIYANGRSLGSGFITNNFALTTLNHPEIGIESSASGFSGWMDEIRIVKNYSYYSPRTDFTPPTAPYPSIDTPYPGI